MYLAPIDISPPSQFVRAGTGDTAAGTAAHLTLARDPEWLWRYLEDGLVHTAATGATATTMANAPPAANNAYERLQQQMQQQQWSPQLAAVETTSNWINSNLNSPMPATHGGMTASTSLLAGETMPQPLHAHPQANPAQPAVVAAAAPVLSRRDRHLMGERQRRADLRDTVAQLVQLFEVREGSSPVNSLKAVLEAAIKAVQRTKALEKEVQQLRLNQQFVAAQLPPSDIAVVRPTQSLKRKTPSIIHDEIQASPLMNRWAQLAATSGQPPQIDPWRIFHSDGVSRVLYSNDNIILDANRVFCSDVRYSREELIGQPLTLITPASKVAICRLVTGSLRHTPAEAVPPSFLNCYLTREKGMVFRFGAICAIWSQNCPKESSGSRHQREESESTLNLSHLNFTAETLGTVPPCSHCNARCLGMLVEGLPTLASDMDSYLRINLQTAVRMFHPHIRSTGFDSSNFFVDGSVTYETTIDSKSSTPTEGHSTPSGSSNPTCSSSSSSSSSSLSSSSLDGDRSPELDRASSSFTCALFGGPMAMANFQVSTLRREVLPQGFRSTIKLFHDLATAAASTRTSPPVLEFGI